MPADPTTLHERVARAMCPPDAKPGPAEYARSYSAIRIVVEACAEHVETAPTISEKTALVERGFAEYHAKRLRALLAAPNAPGNTTGEGK